METANGRSAEKKQSFNQTEPAGPEYININEARENVSTSVFIPFSFYVNIKCTSSISMNGL